MWVQVDKIGLGSSLTFLGLWLIQDMMLQTYSRRHREYFFPPWCQELESCLWWEEPKEQMVCFLVLRGCFILWSMEAAMLSTFWGGKQEGRGSAFLKQIFCNTKCLCNLLLMSCLNEGSTYVGCTRCGGNGGVKPINSWTKRMPRSSNKWMYSGHLEEGPLFPPMRALDLFLRLVIFMKYNLFNQPIFFTKKGRQIWLNCIPWASKRAVLLGADSARWCLPNYNQYS